MPTESQVFKLLSQNDGSRIYHVEAIHVTTSGNRRKYTKEELFKGARSLSFRPLNIDHDWNKALPFPQNGTLVMEFDPTKNAVVGDIKISDPQTIADIDAGRIQAPSIEEFPSQGENCNMLACEQKGVIFTGMALLRTFLGVKPGDREAKISAESLKDVLLSEMLDPEVKKEAKPCSDHTDFNPECEKCKILNKEAVTNCCRCAIEFESESALEEHLKEKHPEIHKEESDSSLQKPIIKETQMSATPQTATETAKPAASAADYQGIVKEMINPFISAVNDGFKNTQQLQIEKLSELIGVIKAESIKKAEPKPSSTVDDTPIVQKESVTNAWNWMQKAIKEEAEGEIPASYAWRLNRESFIKSLPKARSRSMMIGGSVKQEAITYNGADIPEVFDKELFVLPGGRMAVNIRQYLKVKQIPQGADTYNFYQIGGFDVDDTTAEGTEPTNVSQTVTKKQTVPTLYREVQTIKYGDIENAQFDLVEAVNEAALAGSLNVENNLVLNTTCDAATPGEWINGKTGATGLAGDDLAAVETMSKKSILAGLQYLETEGYDTSPGNVVLFAHPKAVRELIEESDTAYFAGSEAQPFTMRQLGILESRFGVTIVPSNKVAAKTQTTTHTYRNIMCIKNHTLALGVTANLQVEAQRRPDLHAIKIGMRHRIGSVVFDPETLVRISSEQ